MRIIRRSGSIYSVASCVGSQGHHAHAVCQASIHSLQALVIEGLGQQHRGNGFNQLGIGDGAALGFVIGDAILGVRFVLPAQAADQVTNGLTEKSIFNRLALLESSETSYTNLRSE